MSSPLLHATDVSRYFGQHCALHDFNLVMHRGEVLALLGTNGAGKTTTLNILTGNLARIAAKFLSRIMISHVNFRHLNRI